MSAYPVFREARRTTQFAAVYAHVLDELDRMPLGDTARWLASILFRNGLLRRSLTVSFASKTCLAVRCQSRQDEVLKALGYSAADIEGLRARAII